MNSNKKAMAIFGWVLRVPVLIILALLADGWLSYLMWVFVGLGVVVICVGLLMEEEREQDS